MRVKETATKIISRSHPVYHQPNFVKFSNNALIRLRQVKRNNIGIHGLKFGNYLWLKCSTIFQVNVIIPHSDVVQKFTMYLKRNVTLGLLLSNTNYSCWIIAFRDWVISISKNKIVTGADEWPTHNWNEMLEEERSSAVSVIDKIMLDWSTHDARILNAQFDTDLIFHITWMLVNKMKMAKYVEGYIR